LIHARVQHHPSRAHLIPGLLVRLEPLPVEVIPHSSDPPNPWQGYKRCLQDIPGCTHLLVIQDDAVPCLNFAAALEQIALSNTECPVSLWLSAQPAGTASRARQAMLRNSRYTHFGWPSYIYLIAMLWPKQKAEEFLAWTESGARISSARDPRADDGIVANWAKATRQEFRVTVPSLVEHPDTTPSVKGGSQKAAAGKDRARVALLLAEDGLAYRW
jgi:hypothetical protein